MRARPACRSAGAAGTQPAAGGLSAVPAPLAGTGSTLDGGPTCLIGSTNWLVENPWRVIGLAPGRERSGQRENRRQALVRSAFDRIADRGFEGLRLRDVAAPVGIDHSTLHHYFAGKEDLVAGVVEYTIGRLRPTMPAAGGPADRLHHHLADLAWLIREQPQLFAVLGELDLRARRDPTVRSIIDGHERGWRGVLTQLLEEGSDEGVWAHGLDVPSAVELIIGTVKGVRLLPDTAEDVLRQLESLLVRQPPDGSDASPPA
jgi:AcrR family transcriptional regulator